MQRRRARAIAIPVSRPSSTLLLGGVFLLGALIFALAEIAASL